MRSSKKSIIICSGQSFNDPLFKGLIYEYLLRVQAQCPGAYRLHLFTEEQAAYAMSSEQRAALRRELAGKDIFWQPIPYRNGRFLILKKLWNFIGLFFKVLGIRLRYKTRLVVGFLAVAGGYAYILSALLRLKLLVFCFEPHSRYMAEFGIWSPRSLKFRLLNRMERLQAVRADYVTAPTVHTVRLLQSWNSRARIFELPISVDTDKFRFDPEMRRSLRERYGMRGRYVLMYLGKFGGIYYGQDEVARFCAALHRLEPRFFFFVVTPDDTRTVLQAFEQAGLEAQKDLVVLDKIPYESIEGYLSACDMGLVAIPPLDSQKYRTPVKIGNYLSCGLPYMVNRGVADDDDLAERCRVGVVLEDLNPDKLPALLPQIQEFMNEDRKEQSLRCRQTGIDRRGLHHSVRVLSDIFAEV